MGRRTDKTITSRPGADELQKIDKLVELLKNRGEQASRSRVMINAAIREFEAETGYSEAEQNCKGCMGPCGICKETQTTKSE